MIRKNVVHGTNEKKPANVVCLALPGFDICVAVAIPPPTTLKTGSASLPSIRQVNSLRVAI